MVYSTRDSFGSKLESRVGNRPQTNASLIRGGLSRIQTTKSTKSRASPYLYLVLILVLT